MSHNFFLPNLSIPMKLSRDDRHLYVGALTSSSNIFKANNGLIFMFSRDEDTGELTLIEVRSYRVRLKIVQTF